MTDIASQPEGRTPIPAGLAFDPSQVTKLLTRFGHGGWLGMRYHGC